MTSFRLQPATDTDDEELRLWASRLLAAALADGKGGTAVSQLLVRLQLEHGADGQTRIDTLADAAATIVQRFNNIDELRNDAERLAFAAREPSEVAEKYDDGATKRYLMLPNPNAVIGDVRALAAALALRKLDISAENPDCSELLKADVIRLLVFTERRFKTKNKPIEQPYTRPDFKAIGAKGGISKNAAKNALKEWILELWRKDTWKSSRDAAKRLTPKAIEHGHTIGVSLVPDNAERTVYEWIRAAKKHV